MHGSTATNTQPLGRPPIGLRWRSSYWFTTLVVALGIATDQIVYSIVIPVIPFQLQKLGYEGVSSLTGWLLFTNYASLFMTTMPIAMFSERYNARKIPLIIGLVILIGAQIMFMEAPVYSVMIIARVLQGIGSCMVWVIGLALLCDATPERYIARQLGIAMSALPLGLLIGPPVGGALYRLGWRGPIIFSLTVTVIDLIGRLLIIERKEALRWGIDPAAALPESEATIEGAEQAYSGAENMEEKAAPKSNDISSSVDIDKTTVALTVPDKPTSFVSVVAKLCRSSRALTSIWITFIYAVVYSTQQPTIPLRLQSVWNLDSSKVGLVFLAAVIPTLFSSPFAGWYTGKHGPEWLSFGALVLALPWFAILIVKGPLALFIVSFALESFFISSILPVLTAELAAVSRGIKGIGYGHIYGAFNLAYGVGAAVGPILGGQVYDHAKDGWLALCLIAVGTMTMCIVLSFFYTGEDPLANRLWRLMKRPNTRSSDPDQDTIIA